MSAWIVSKLHIDVMVQALQGGEIVVDRTPDELGRALWLENVASIHGRYPDTAENDDDYPGPIDFRQADAQAYVYEAPTKDRLRDAYDHRHYALPGDEDITPDVLLKVFGCYAYQTCEHAGWESSEAFQWVETMTKNLVKAGARAGDFVDGHIVPGNAEYERAPWGL